MLKKLTQKRNKKGFTLVELVVVIAILGILAAIAVPRLTGFRDNAGLAADQSSAASIAKAADLYVASHNITDPDTGENGNVTIKLLEDDGLIDKGLAPQNSKGESFVLTYDDDNNQFVVSYNEEVSGIEVLYPEPKE